MECIITRDKSITQTDAQKKITEVNTTSNLFGSTDSRKALYDAMSDSDKKDMYDKMTTIVKEDNGKFYNTFGDAIVEVYNSDK